jgi:hypothetical protein
MFSPSKKLTLSVSLCLSLSVSVSLSLVSVSVSYCLVQRNMESSLGGKLVRTISSRFFNFGYNICIDGYMCIVHGCINMYVQSVGTHLYPCHAQECNAHTCILAMHTNAILTMHTNANRARSPHISTCLYMLS